MRTDSRAISIATLVTGRDLDQLRTRLTEDIRLRALLPGGGIEVHGRDDVLKMFDQWFGDCRTVVLEDAGGELVGDRLLVHYRLGFELQEGPHTLTQTWVASVGDDGLIFRIDLVCSGFRRVAA